MRRSKYISNIITRLTDREIEVLKYLMNGKSNIEIAKELTISNSTAKVHVCSIMHKMKAKDRTNAVINAIKTGVIEI